MKTIRILVVDDEVPITRGLKRQLEATGRFEVQTENSGLAALKTARQFAPEVVLLDVMMPDMDGGQVKAQLTQMPECEKTLVIFLTALYQDSDANDKELFIAKPVNADKIVQFIDQHLQAE